MPESLLDRNRPDDAHTDARLAAAPVTWLGTTSPNAVLGSPAALTQWRAAFCVPVLVTITKLTAWTRHDGQLRYRTVR